ncbi:hypothetical protein [Cellulomonas sp. URHD0024]|uniref:hypothetical protein n=1 Tax=Cellulomonas sp. URHD0024 TaxID=1302620 RepID=UPI0004214E6A|nr:hypothetical protein [Cellulomonas sp. URHD0024]
MHNGKLGGAHDREHAQRAAGSRPASTRSGRPGRGGSRYREHAERAAGLVAGPGGLPGGSARVGRARLGPAERVQVAASSEKS